MEHVKPTPSETSSEQLVSEPLIDERGAWLSAVAWEIHGRRHQGSLAPLSRTSLFCALLLLERHVRLSAEVAGLRTREFFTITNLRGLPDEPLPDTLPTPPIDLALTRRLADLLALYRMRRAEGNELDRLFLAHLVLSDSGGPLSGRLERAGATRETIRAALEQSIRRVLAHRFVRVIRFRRDQLLKGSDAVNAAGTTFVGRVLALGSTVTAIDHLNRLGLVEALAAMLEDPHQETPLTIALLGDWGAGKSTLMALLRERLTQLSPRRFCFADFNAWEYELTDNMAAGLAQEVVAGLTADTRLRLPLRHRARSGPRGQHVGGERRRLTRWLSPGFWWLFVGFVLRRHGMRLVGIALLLVALGWAVRESLLTPELIAPGDDDLQNAIRLAGALGGAVGLFFLLRAVKHVLEHPFAIGLKTYLRLPRYEHHLGLVPVIKREVEALASLWLGRTWAQRLIVNWVERRDRTTLCPRLERWSRPRRLVVFVDDLDRCSHARIGQTLDAIRLVMDVPQVIVVLGIDPRIAFQAMALQYKDFADPQRNKEEIARDYLGKIIQVPIRLRRPSVDDLDGFVRDRLFAGVRTESSRTPTGGTALERREGIGGNGGENPPLAAQEPPATPVAGDDVSAQGATFRAAFDDHEGEIDGARFGVVGRASGMAPPAPSPPEPPRHLHALRRHLAEVMRPDDEERQTFQELVRAFHFHNPRQLIRLFNSYSLLKLFATTRRREGEPEVPRLALMRTLFLEELLHESPTAWRNPLERALSDEPATVKLPERFLSLVASIRAASPAASDGDTAAPPAREDWAALLDRDWRDFVRLVVLPASVDEVASDEQRPQVEPPVRPEAGSDAQPSRQAP